MSTVAFNHKANLHTLDGARAALRLIFPGDKPQSLLDVGCGVGNWLAAALELGIEDVYGIDGIAIQFEELLIPQAMFRQQNLVELWALNRRFDAVLCLEVAEHLPPVSSMGLINALVQHSDFIVFSAACPGQPGQNHVNCQWPSYWQELFNDRGYSCSSAVREHMWNDARIEPWYRQNIFVARLDPANSGKEPRITSVIHPDIIPWMEDYWRGVGDRLCLEGIQSGHLRLRWYLKALGSAIFTRLFRRWTTPWNLSVSKLS